MTLFPRILELLKNEGMDHVLVIGGGIMPDEDITSLEGQGVHKLFGPGTPTSAPIDFVRKHFAERASGAASSS
jgi:methylmalonyl-CoA mutase C-terminal domain/subunit